MGIGNISRLINWLILQTPMTFFHENKKRIMCENTCFSKTREILVNINIGLAIGIGQYVNFIVG